MGVDHNIYIGGYVKVRMQIKRVIGPAEHKLGCKIAQLDAQVGQKSKQSGKFCSDCGSDLSAKIAILEYQDIESIVGDSFWVANDNKLCHRDKTSFTEKAEEWEFIAILVPNTKGSGGHSIEAYEDFELKINRSVIDETTDTFRKTNQKNITKLKKAYGELSVEIHYGVIAYCS